MAAKMRAELSTKNPYWIDRHRYYELKHFCLQYPTWKRIYASLGGISSKPIDILHTGSNGIVSDPTAGAAIAKMYYSDRMCMLEQIANNADPEIGKYILIGVTEGMSYDILNARLNVPCCKDVYYDRYRKFFWLLSKERG